MKRIFAIIMTICLLASTLCIPAFAAGDAPAAGTVLRVSALKKDGTTIVVIKDYDNFEDGWNAAMGLAGDSKELKKNAYERVIVDFYADWNADAGEFTDDWINGDGFKNDTIYIPEGAKVTLNLNGHTINRGLERTISDGEVMYIEDEADVIINDGTITGGCGDMGDAGAIDIQDDARVTLNNVHIVGNTSGWDGAGIFVGSGSILTVNGGSFKNNDAFGKAIAYSSYGGAVHVEGTAIFDGVEFKENAAVYGAAISADNGNVVVKNCTFDENGIESKYSVSHTVIHADASKITITNSTFTNNGGEELFYFEDSDVLIEGGSITGNTSEELFCFEDSEADIKFVTITGNTSKTLYADNGDKVVTIVGCTFGNNTPATDAPDVEVDDEGTLIFLDSTLGDTTFEDEDYVKVEYSGVAEGDASIKVTLLYNDGTEETTYYRFFEYGWNLAMEAAKTNSYDRIVVDLLGDWNTDTNDYGALIIPENARVTLNMNGHTIDRSTGSGLNGEVLYISTNADVIINDGTITGGYSTVGAGGIHIKDNARVILNDVNVVGNSSNGSNGAAIAVYDGAILVMNGGCISDSVLSTFEFLFTLVDVYPYGTLYVEDATATLKGVTINGNRSTDSNIEGVAIYANNSTVTLNDCVVSNNGTTDNYYDYAESIIGGKDSTIIITNTDFTGNGSISSTSDIDYSHLFYLEDSSLTIDGGKITGNKADKLFYFDDSKADLKGVTITENESVVFDVDNSSAKVTLAECVLGNNSPVKYDDDIIVDTKGTLVLTDCDLGDTTFKDKGMVTFSDKAVGSIFGEGSLAMIVSFVALIASAAAIVVNVSSKKKAVPVATNEAADTETDDEE